MVTVLAEVCSYRLDRKTAKSVSISMYSKEFLLVGKYQYPLTASILLSEELNYRAPSKGI